MDLRVYRIRLMSLIVVVLGAAMVWLWPHHSRPSNTGLFSVHFLDVGQGDATLFETPEGVQVLIDGGRDTSVLRELAAQLGYFDRTIDIVIATHPDSDHISGLVDVLARYEVDTIIMTENEKDTPDAADFMRAVSTEGATVVYARAGMTYTLGASTTLSILFPDRDPSGFESNASSIITRVSYGTTDVVVTGDAPQSIEDFLVRQHGAGLQSEILKLGHHGSDTSTSDAFLDTVRPQYAIVSAGKDNRYGHPHREVVERVTARSITLRQTTEGTITFVSDGITLSER